MRGIVVRGKGYIVWYIVFAIVYFSYIFGGKLHGEYKILAQIIFFGVLALFMQGESEK